MNVHTDCMGQVGKCQTKSRLLRRQKSTSEIESRVHEMGYDEESKCFKLMNYTIYLVLHITIM